MRIILDAMGGDNAPTAPMLGAAAAVREYGVTVLAVGHKEKLAEVIRQHNIPMEGIEIVHAEDAIDMSEDASNVVRKKPNSSLAVALRLLKEDKGDAFVSAGSTGAVLMGATLIVGRIKGIKRAAIGTVMPGGTKPWMLIDVGANSECRADMLVQFAIMGSAYMEKVMGITSPRVALANNGAEETKGTALQLEAYSLLQKSGLNFVGNIEGRDIPSGEVADVVTCDGFTGNIILKLVEGTAKLFAGMIKEMFYSSGVTKMAGLMMKKELAAFKKKFDYSEYGGSPMLGIKKAVIKAHGSSNDNAIKHAIRQAITYAKNDVPGTIETWVASHKKAQTGQEDADVQS